MLKSRVRPEAVGVWFSASPAVRRGCSSCKVAARLESRRFGFRFGEADGRDEARKTRADRREKTMERIRERKRWTLKRRAGRRRRRRGLGKAVNHRVQAMQKIRDEGQFVGQSFGRWNRRFCPGSAAGEDS